MCANEFDFGTLGYIFKNYALHTFRVLSTGECIVGILCNVAPWIFSWKRAAFLYRSNLDFFLCFVSIYKVV